MKLRFKGQNPKSVSEVMRKLMELDPADYIVKVEKVRKIRSMNAERYYRGVILKMIADEMGEIDLERIHEMLSEKFKPKKIIVWPDGKRVELPLSNADMDRKQHSEFLNKCKHFAATELNCYIPSAGDLTNEQYEEISKNQFY